MKLLFFVLFVVGTCTAKAQVAAGSADFKKNAIHAEALGNALIYSVNYERVIRSSGALPIAVRVGISYIDLSEEDKPQRSFGIPIELLGWTGKKNGHFEFGLGYSYHEREYRERANLNVYRNIETTQQFLTARLGYRFQKPTGGFMFKTALVSMLLFAEDTNDPSPIELPVYVPWPGVSVGWAF